MFFGLINSLATLQTMMNEIFRDLIDRGVLVVYMDDLLVYTKTMKEHREAIREVLKCLRENNLFLKFEKCYFEQDRCEFLGVIITSPCTHIIMSLDILTQNIAMYPGVQ